jgi:hypothetical protein
MKRTRYDQDHQALTLQVPFPIKAMIISPSPSLRDSLEPDEEPVIYPLEHRPPPLNQIPASQHAQYSEIPTEQELQEFVATPFPLTQSQLHSVNPLLFV